jgi:hypothetical protein
MQLYDNDNEQYISQRNMLGMYWYRSNYDRYNKLCGTAHASYNSDFTHNAIDECYFYY